MRFKLILQGEHQNVFFPI